MIVLGFPILLYLIGFSALLLACRWWAFVPVAAVVFSLEWRYRGILHEGSGFVARTADTMLLLAVIGTVAGFSARALMLATGWSALRGRGLALTLTIFVSVPVIYGLTANGR